MRSGTKIERNKDTGIIGFQAEDKDNPFHIYTKSLCLLLFGSREFFLPTELDYAI